MLADGEFIAEANLGTSMTQASTRPAEPVAIQRRDLPAPLIEIEREHIIKTLDQVRGNKAVAARLLGISRRAFYRQLERHGLHHRVPMGSPDLVTSPAPLEQAS